MILLQSPSRFLLQVLLNRVQNIDKGVELDCHSVEFDDVRLSCTGDYLVATRYPHFMQLSMSLPTPPPETVFFCGLPFGAIEAVKATYGLIAQILDPPKDGYNLTMKLNFAKLPLDEDEQYDLLIKVASLREVVLGAPLRVVLKHLASRTVAPDIDQLVALVHRPKESFFLVPEDDKVTVVFPMRFKDSVDTVLAASFLQVQFRPVWKSLYNKSTVYDESNSNVEMSRSRSGRRSFAVIEGKSFELEWWRSSSGGDEEVFSVNALLNNPTKQYLMAVCRPTNFRMMEGGEAIAFFNTEREAERLAKMPPLEFWDGKISFSRWNPEVGAISNDSLLAKEVTINFIGVPLHLRTRTIAKLAKDCGMRW
ncbi:hypothetical protein IFM89_012798 [Coptis chinensis]|uniref:Arp2/3 complex 34 kDa subunit n=1 Tax=Coptis chinensis TaxID=261450 RepID=A0A835LH25_9MAGN|nr:hypothetical protein IFM89_012798 [Coptis chinensis]